MSGRKADPEHLARLGFNLRRLRKARQLTQERLAELCGLQKNYISDIENGRIDPRVRNFQKIARGLGCSADELLRELPKR